MPVKFQIMPARGLTVVTYSGFVTFEESLIAAQRYTAHPDFRPDQKFLFDSTHVTGHEKDMVKFFEMQSRMVEVFAQTGRDQLVGCVAPTETAREMAVLVQRSWEPVDHLVMMIHEEEAEVLSFLGQPEASVSELIQAAAR